MTALIWFVLGFLTRAMIAYVDDLIWKWRVLRHLYSAKGETIMRWKVRMSGITWDDGKGEYDVSNLPKDLEITVIANDQAEALEHAMTEASDTYGSLIEGCTTFSIQAIKPNPRAH